MVISGRLVTFLKLVLYFEDFVIMFEIMQYDIHFIPLFLNYNENLYINTNTYRS